jgi:AraC-like DNA-binding protein
MRPADLAPTVFSTVGLPATRRVELWETHNATALIGLQVRTARPLEATELNVQLPHVHLARVSGSPHAVARTPGVIRSNPADGMVIYLPLRGASTFQYPERTVVLSPGTLLACETDRPFARAFARGLEELVVKVPRETCAARAGISALPEPLFGEFSGDGNSYARALARIAGRATRPGHALPADERTVLDLVAAVIGGQRAASAVAHRAAARAYIEEHLTDPGLGAGQIAAATGISERQLSRIFAADGVSVPRHILCRRLQLARTLLSAPLAPARSVADVAACCGFTSAAYFSHAFRAHFGERASDVTRR